MNDIKDFIYLILIKKDNSITKKEIKKIIYKIIFNKVLRINEIMNKILKYFIKFAISQIKLLFKKCYKERI